MTEHIIWLSNISTSDLIFIFITLCIIDIPRFFIAHVVMIVYDMFVPKSKKKLTINYNPSVCAVIAGVNEGESVYECLESIYGSYPRLDIIVVDDGSTDNMLAEARRFKRSHPDVLIMTRKVRGGKSSAINLGVAMTKAEIIIMMDSDGKFSDNAIYNIVQPFKDEQVGVVAGAVNINNVTDSLISWLQAFEYANTMAVGREWMSRFGTLNLASGAFCAMRRRAMNAGGNLDATIAEDLDIVTRLKKMGWKVVYTQAAECLTNCPTSLISLFKQRMRWDRSYIRTEVVKHNSVASLKSSNFKLSSFYHWYEMFIINVILTFGFWITFTYNLFVHDLSHIIKIHVWLFIVYTVFAVLNCLVMLYYTNNMKRDLFISLVSPLYFFYSLFLRFTRLCAILDEVLFRSSYNDNFIPSYIRSATKKNLGWF